MPCEGLRLRGTALGARARSSTRCAASASATPRWTACGSPARSTGCARRASPSSARARRRTTAAAARAASPKSSRARGVCVVSGLALGIDGAAHEGALAAGAPTIGVLGGGHDHFFPPRHRELAARIVARRRRRRLAVRARRRRAAVAVPRAQRRHRGARRRGGRRRGGRAQRRAQHGRPRRRPRHPGARVPGRRRPPQSRGLQRADPRRRDAVRDADDVLAALPLPLAPPPRRRARAVRCAPAQRGARRRFGRRSARSRGAAGRRVRSRDCSRTGSTSRRRSCSRCSPSWSSPAASRAARTATRYRQAACGIDMDIPRLGYSRHARERMESYHISEDEVEAVVWYPVRRDTTPTRGRALRIRRRRTQDQSRDRSIRDVRLYHHRRKSPEKRPARERAPPQRAAQTQMKHPIRVTVDPECALGYIEYSRAVRERRLPRLVREPDGTSCVSTAAMTKYDPHAPHVDGLGRRRR